MSPGRFGRYVAVRLLYQGERAEVYEALDSLTDRRVALKLFLAKVPGGPSFAEAFRAEAARIMALRHRHIAPLYDFDSSEGRPFVVTEYLSGGTLRDRLAELRQHGQTMPPEEAARILEPIAAALDYAHSQGVVHGAVKPGNIMFTSAGEPLLTDFGVARTLAQMGISDAVPALYLAPERAAGSAPDAASDVYALGVVLYEMITGQPPFQGESPAVVLWQHQNAPLPPPRQLNPNLTEEVEGVILRALAKKPAERFGSAEEMVRAFRMALAAQPAPVRKAEPAKPKEDWLVKLARAVGVIAPLAGKTAPTIAEAPKDTSSRLAAILGIIGMLFAVYQVLSQLFKIILTPIAPLMNYLSYLIAPLFLVAAALALYVALRTPAGARRKYTLRLFALITVVGLAWGAWSAYVRLRPPTGYVVAIADFKPSKETLDWVDFAGRFAQYLESELSGMGANVQIVRTREAYEASKSARAAGERRKATVVVWGWYDADGVSLRAEALQVPILLRESMDLTAVAQAMFAGVWGGAGASPAQTAGNIGRFVRVPATLTDFEVFARSGPQQVAYVSTAILGLAFYVNDDLDHALVMFDKAVKHSQAGGTDILGADTVLFYRSIVLYRLGRLDEGVADLQQAIVLNPDFYDAHYNLALMLAETCTPARQLDAAIAEVEKCVRLRPDDARARLLLADLYRQARRYKDALSSGRQAVQMAPDNADAYEVLANVESALGLTEEAEQSRQKALSLRAASVAGKPTDAFQAHLDLADAYMTVGNYEKAIAEYEAARNLKPDDYRVHWGLGNAYRWTNATDKAEAEYKAWASAAPKDPNPHLLLGMLYQQAGRADDALAEFKRAAEVSSCDPAAHYMLGSAYFGRGDYAASIAAFERAIAIEPWDAEALYMIGSLYYLQGDLGESSKHLRAALDLKPDMAEAHYALGVVYSELGQYEQAVAEHSLAVRFAPQEAAYHTSLGNAYWDLQDWKRAAEAYRNSLALEDDPNVRVFLCSVYVQLARYEAALTECEKAIAADPKSEIAYSGLGEVYLRMGRVDDAIAAYLRQAEVSDSVELRKMVASLYLSQGKPEQAVEQYQKAIALAPGDSGILAALGDVYLQMGQDADAENAYRSALAVKQDLAAAHYGLGRIAYRRCNLSGMEQELKTAVSLAPQVSLYRATLGGAYEARGRDDQASVVYADLAALPTSDAVAHIMEGSYLLRKGDLNGAQAELESVLDVPNLPPVVLSWAHQSLGVVHYRAGRLVAAASELQAALAALPTNADAQRLLGDIALRNGDVEGALAAYDAATALLPDYRRQVGGDESAFLGVVLEIRRGLALARKGSAAESASALDKAVSLAEGIVARAPLWPRAHYALALAYLARGDASKADTALAAATQCDASFLAEWKRAEAELALLR